MANQLAAQHHCWAFFISASEVEAGSYGLKVDHLYMDLRNPAVIPYRVLHEFESNEHATKYRKFLIPEGHDGIILYDDQGLGASENIIVFNPDQVIAIPPDPLIFSSSSTTTTSRKPGYLFLKQRKYWLLLFWACQIMWGSM